MESKHCFIEFEIKSAEKFYALKHIFELIKDAKNRQEPKGDKFWVDFFPKYALEKFFFLDTDAQPSYQTAAKGEFVWHFYSLIELLEINYEIEYVSCFQTEKNKGKITYDPYSYPYGGIDGLVVFVNSFDCKPIMIDDGTSLYEIEFLGNGDYSITDTENSLRQKSSVKRFDATALLYKFARRLKDR